MDRTSDVTEGAGRHAAWIFAREATADLARATQEWMKTANWNEAARLAEAHVSKAAHFRAGHAFEFVETLKFNATSAAANSTLKASTTASQGASGAAADIIISRGDETVRHVQAKVFSKATNVLRELSAEKYDGMQRLVPIDQEKETRDRLARDLGMNPEGIHISGYRNDVRENLAGELHHGGISSGGTSRAEAYRAGADPKGWLREQSIEAAVNETLKATAVGAAGGAVFGAAAHSLRLGLRTRHGELSVSESVVEVAAVAANAGVRSGVTSGLAKVVEIGARNSEILSPLAETTAPVAIASAVVSISEAAYQYAIGNIERHALVDRCGEVALRNSGAWAFGVVGQTVVPVPVVGALVGSTVGYVTSAVVLEGFKLARVAAAAADAAEARLRELEVQALAAVKTMEEQRLTLEILIDQEAEHFRAAIVPLMDRVEAGLAGGDDWLAMEGLVALNLALGDKLEWSTLPEFDDFMADGERFLEL